MAQVNVTIIGLQRIGASMGLALKRLSKSPSTSHEFVITGSDENRETLKTARTMGAIDQDVRDPGQAVQQADIVLLASPYGLVKDMLEVIGPELKPGAVVIDFSPLKLPSIAWAQQYFRKGKGAAEAYLVGVTPLINPDYLNDPREGIEAARADMFDRGSLIVSPAPTCPEEAVQLAAELTTLLGLKVHFTDPAEHDGIVAAMENLPVLLHMALFRSVSGSPAWNDLQRLGNPLFALATYRLGTDKPEDVAAFVEHNRKNTIRVLEAMTTTLTEITDLLRDADAETIAEAFAASSEQYQRWQTTRAKNKWDEADELPRIQSPGLLGSFGGMLKLGGRKSSDERRK
ncbi:MAG: prephenate dehydrogenase [Chloroflexota bacterium]